MKISVVTVVRNDASHIEETMKSVLEQDYPDVEYIVIDGNSSDGTAEIVRSYADRLAFFVSEPDKGIYDAMNKGIRRSTGEVVGMINSGDRYFPGALSKVAAAFGPEPGRRIFWGDVEYEHLGRVRGFRENRRYIGAFAPHPSMFVPRSVYDEIGLYDDTFRLLGDYDFMYRAVNVCGVGVLYLPELIAFYREGGLSDRLIARCLADELRVKIRYGRNPAAAFSVYLLKLVKNLPRILLAKK
ncbi:MAG: glycosyltransferase [Lentisphaeria bacterium]|nr:glycosyltransferase [Lentisphaeria bacterium]